LWWALWWAAGQRRLFIAVLGGGECQEPVVAIGASLTPIPVFFVIVAAGAGAYISVTEYAALDPGVRDHEPARALLAGGRIPPPPPPCPLSRRDAEWGGGHRVGGAHCHAGSPAWAGDPANADRPTADGHFGPARRERGDSPDSTVSGIGSPPVDAAPRGTSTHPHMLPSVRVLGGITKGPRGADPSPCPAGPTGLEFYERLAAELPDRLHPGGCTRDAGGASAWVGGVEGGWNTQHCPS